MKRVFLLPALLLSLSPLATWATNPEAGKKLVDANCQSCHQEQVYTRPNRKIKSLPQLRTQVRRCELALGLKWFDEEIDNAAAYLNEQYYKFE